MTDKGVPFIDDIRTFLSDDAGHAVIDIVTGPHMQKFAVTQADLMMIIGKLQLLNAEMEKRRREIDPGAGKAGDTVPLTAIKASSVNTATVPGTDEGAVIFQTMSGPQAFLLTKEAMVLLAQSLLGEAGRKVPPRKLDS